MRLVGLFSQKMTITQILENRDARIDSICRLGAIITAHCPGMQIFMSDRDVSSAKLCVVKDYNIYWWRINKNLEAIGMPDEDNCDDKEFKRMMNDVVCLFNGSENFSIEKDKFEKRLIAGEFKPRDKWSGYIFIVFYLIIMSSVCCLLL